MDISNLSGKTLNNPSMESLLPKRHPKFLLLMVLIGLITLAIIGYVKTREPEQK